MKKIRVIGIILSILGIFLLIPNTTYARRSKNVTDILIATVESCIEHGNYEEAKRLIYEHFPYQFEYFINSFTGQPLNSDEHDKLIQTLDSSETTILEIMSSQVYKTSTRLTEKSRLIPLKTKIDSAEFGYLTVLLFICELRTGALDGHRLSQTMPDLYSHLNGINFAYFMSDFNTAESEEIQKYKIKTQELLTEHLQAWLSKDLGEKVFDVEDLENFMSEDELREYCYYQTLATLVLHIKGFDVPNFSDLIGITENPEGVNIVSSLALTPEGLAVFREGSHYPEANFIIVPFFEWFDATENGRLAVKKGYMYTKEGLFFMEFDELLEIQYLINYLSPADGYLHNILDQIIDHYAIPNTNFERFGILVNNKAVSLPLLRGAGINVPRGGLNFKSTKSIFSVMQRVETFILQQQIDEIVVKPFNTNCGTGIAYFKKEQIAQASEYIEKLTEEYGGVRYEERIYPPKIRVEGELHDWNLRVFLSRDAEDNWVVSDIAVRYGNGVVNISKGAGTMTWDNLISLLGISNSEADDLRENVEKMSVRAARVIEDEAVFNLIDEKTTSIHEDFMSTDVICSQDLTPYIIELNNHSSGAMWNLDNAGREMGRSSRDFILTMIRRATEYRESLNDDEE